MRQTVVAIPSEEIVDWDSFHLVFRRELGFPDFYGCNMNAWINCMTSVDAPEDGMSTVMVAKGEMLALRVDGALEFRRRCPEQFDALVEGVAFVNFRRVEVGESAVLALLLVGDLL